MQEILYREVPTPDTAQVIQWLHGDWHPSIGKKSLTPQGIRVQLDTPTSDSKDELSIFLWSLQRTTYLKVFCRANQPTDWEKKVTLELKEAL